MRALRAVLGEASAGSPVATVVVRISRLGRAFTAKIAFSGALNGEREVSGDKCASVAEATILIVAMSANPLAIARYVATSREEGAAAERADRLRSRIALRFAGDFGTLPEFSIAPGVQLGLSRGPIHLDLELQAWLPRLRWISDPGRPDPAGEIGLWEVGLRGCYDLLRASALSFGPCATAAFGLSVGEGKRIDDPEKSAGFWSGAQLGVQVRQTSDRMVFVLGVDVGFSWFHPEYVITDVGPVFRHSDYFGRAWIAFGWWLS